MSATDSLTERPVALVTGASAGIGKMFAQRLAASGHDLLLIARDGVRLKQIADELSLQYGINAEAMPADLARDEGMRSVANRIAQMEIQVNGKGVIGDSIHRPNILYRILLGILPF